MFCLQIKGPKKVKAENLLALAIFHVTILEKIGQKALSPNMDMNGKTILVIGAAGFIGALLVQESLGSLEKTKTEFFKLLAGCTKSATAVCTN